jgi:hypothetical protein
MQSGEINPQGFKPLMAGMFHVVQKVCVIDNPLEVAFIIANYELIHVLHSFHISAPVSNIGGGLEQSQLAARVEKILG